MMSTSCTALILCGGRAERLGGIDKPLRMLAGRPLLEHVLATLDLSCQDIVISANRNADRYRRYARIVVDDGAHADCGPLAGLVAGMAVAHGEDVLCLPGDAPALPGNLRSRLEAARRRQHCGIAVVDDGSGLQPLCLLLPRAERDSLTTFLEGGGRAVHRWLESRPHARCDCSDRPRWSWSLNTDEEWSLMEQRLAQGSQT